MRDALCSSLRIIAQKSPGEATLPYCDYPHVTGEQSEAPKGRVSCTEQRQVLLGEVIGCARDLVTWPSLDPHFLHSYGMSRWGFSK